MRFRREDAATVTAPVAEKASQAESAKWSNGNALGSKVVTAVVVAALACGPVALFVAHGNQVRPVEAATTTVKPALSILQQSAGAYAVGFVGAWLSATQADSSALDDYINSNAITLSTTPFEYKNIAAASVSTGSGNMISVTVAADVKDSSITDATVQTWPRRYFQVTLSDAKNTLTAVTLPAPVAGPKVSTDAPNLGYSTSLAANDNAAQPVMLFLGAYLTGQGETEPYTSPSTNIPAIDPVPYASVSPLTITADQAPAASPADGATLSVLATVAVQNAVGQTLTATYVLDLRARAGRWEVFAVDTSPALAQTADSIAPTPSPSGDGNQEGN